MAVLWLNVCRLCVPSIMSLGICFIKNCISSKLARLLDTASKFALFSVSSVKDEQLIKKQTYMRTENASSILEYFEYFCQISSKSILIILNYTVLKFALFWDAVYINLSLGTATTVASVDEAGFMNLTCREDHCKLCHCASLASATVTWVPCS